MFGICQCPVACGELGRSVSFTEGAIKEVISLTQNAISAKMERYKLLKRG